MTYNVSTAEWDVKPYYAIPYFSSHGKCPRLGGTLSGGLSRGIMSDGNVRGNLLLTWETSHRSLNV